ncbi:MAG: hypothetical protein K2M13_08645 [Muribaculaceae bacterium]|nr:hypothetical protein [Muribaculaceae bacterium]
MDKDVTNAKQKSDDALSDKKKFKGYTIEELRYQRALVALQKEFCKAKVINRIDHLRNRKSGSEDTSSKIARYGKFAGKLLTGLNYLDYAMIGMSLFGSGKKIYKFLKQKK